MWVVKFCVKLDSLVHLLGLEEPCPFHHHRFWAGKDSDSKGNRRGKMNRRRRRTRRKRKSSNAFTLRFSPVFNCLGESDISLILRSALENEKQG